MDGKGFSINVLEHNLCRYAFKRVLCIVPLFGDAGAKER